MPLHTCPSRQDFACLAPKECWSGSVAVHVSQQLAHMDQLATVSRHLFQKVTGASFTPLTLRSLHLYLSLLFGHDADCMPHPLMWHPVCSLCPYSTGYVCIRPEPPYTQWPFLSCTGEVLCWVLQLQHFCSHVTVKPCMECPPTFSSSNGLQQPLFLCQVSRLYQRFQQFQFDFLPMRGAWFHQPPLPPCPLPPRPLPPRPLPPRMPPRRGSMGPAGPL